MKPRDYLQAFRIHTASLTIPAVLIGYLLAVPIDVGGSRWWSTLAGWFAYGFLFHFSGFGNNNIMDLEADMRDPAKGHFALVKGTVPVRHAVFLDILAYVALTALLFALAHGVGLYIGLVSIACGLLYNLTSKSSTFATAWIVGAFAPLPAIAYYTYRPTVTWYWWPDALLTALLAYGALFIAYQIFIEGYLKDLEADKVNPLRTWGTRILRVQGNGATDDSEALQARLRTDQGGSAKDPVLVIDSRTRRAGMALRLGLFGPIAALLFIRRDILSFVSSLSFVVFVLVASNGYLRPNQLWDRQRVVREAAVQEILVYVTLILVLAPFWGWAVTVAMIVWPLVWFIGFNKVLWGSRLVPRV